MCVCACRENDVFISIISGDIKKLASRALFTGGNKPASNVWLLADCSIVHIEFQPIPFWQQTQIVFSIVIPNAMIIISIVTCFFFNQQQWIKLNPCDISNFSVYTRTMATRYKYSLHFESISDISSAFRYDKEKSVWRLVMAFNNCRALLFQLNENWLQVNGLVPTAA